MKNEFRVIERPPGGWCSELGKESESDKKASFLAGVFISLIVGTLTLPNYIVRSYVRAYETIKKSNTTAEKKDAKRRVSKRDGNA